MLERPRFESSVKTLQVSVFTCVFVAFVAFSGACEGKGPVKQGEAVLALLAVGSEPVPAEAADAPIVEVLPDKTPTIPDAPIVKLAIDREVHWGLVKAILETMEQKGQKPVFLVAERRRIKTFYLNDKLDGPIIRIYADTKGKICIKHPAAHEAKCQKTPSEEYIDGSFTRELVREAAKGYDRWDFRVDPLPQNMTWRDVVTVLGASRSCCKREVRVRLKD